MPEINTNIIILDFETYYSDEYTLKRMTTEEYIRDPRFQVIGCSFMADGETNAGWVPGHNVEKALKTFFRDWEDKIVIAHNAAFDGAILNWHYGIRPKYLFCTMSMARPFSPPHIGVSLNNLSGYYALGTKGFEVAEAKGKRLEHFTPTELKRYGGYCNNDVELTQKLFRKLMSLGFPKNELPILSDMIKCYTEPAIVIDVPIVRASLEEAINKRENLLLQISPDTEKALKMIRSDDIFAEMLKLHGIDPPTKVNKNGEIKWAFAKTDVEFAALEEDDNEEVGILVSTRLDSKSTQRESRSQRFLDIASRGLMPYPMSYYAAHTGRPGGWDKINPLNFKRNTKEKKEPLRMAMKALPGYVFVVGDSSQIEARVLPWLACQEDILQDFRNGVDTYCTLATQFFGRTITKADEVERFVGKTARLGLGFGTGDAKFQLTLKRGQGKIKVDWPLEKCTEAVNIYRASSPMVVNFWKAGQTALERMVAGEGFVFGRNDCLKVEGKAILLPSGFKINYWNLRKQQQLDPQGQPMFTKGGQPKMEFVYDKKSERTGRAETVKIYGAKVVENIVQALAGSIVRYQWGLIRKQYRILGHVYDELMVQVPAFKQEEGLKFVEHCMRQLPAWAEGVPVDCEVGSGLTYGDAK